MLRLECVVVNVLDVANIEEDARDFQGPESPLGAKLAETGTWRGNINVPKFWCCSNTPAVFKSFFDPENPSAVRLGARGEPYFCRVFAETGRGISIELTLPRLPTTALRPENDRSPILPAPPH